MHIISSKYCEKVTKKFLILHNKHILTNMKKKENDRDKAE